MGVCVRAYIELSLSGSVGSYVRVLMSKFLFGVHVCTSLVSMEREPRPWRYALASGLKKKKKKKKKKANRGLQTFQLNKKLKKNIQR